MPRFNAHLLHEQVKLLPNLNEEESILLTSFHNIMSNLTESMVMNETDAALVHRDLCGFRLDWFRFQAYTSVAKSPVDLRNQERVGLIFSTILENYYPTMKQDRFSRLMHTFHFHSSLIDDQATLLEYTSDLSLFCWYQDLFKKIFQETLSNPTMTRHSGAFPVICSHFYSCRHELCPEEFTMLRSRSLTLARSFLEKMALEGKKLLIHLYNQKVALADKEWLTV